MCVWEFRKCGYHTGVPDYWFSHYGASNATNTAPSQLHHHILFPLTSAESGLSFMQKEIDCKLCNLSLWVSFCFECTLLMSFYPDIHKSPPFCCCIHTWMSSVAGSALHWPLVNSNKNQRINRRREQWNKKKKNSFSTCILVKDFYFIRRLSTKFLILIMFPFFPKIRVHSHQLVPIGDSIIYSLVQDNFGF